MNFWVLFQIQALLRRKKRQIFEEERHKERNIEVDKENKKTQGITNIQSSKSSATSRSKRRSKHSNNDCFQSNWTCSTARSKTIGKHSSNDCILPCHTFDEMVIVFDFTQLPILSCSGGHNTSLWNLCCPCVKWGHRRKIQNTQETALCVEARRWWSYLTLDQSKIPRGLNIMAKSALVLSTPTFSFLPLPIPPAPAPHPPGILPPLSLSLPSRSLSLPLSDPSPFLSPAAPHPFPLLMGLLRTDGFVLNLKLLSQRVEATGCICKSFIIVGACSKSRHCKAVLKKGEI